MKGSPHQHHHQKKIRSQSPLFSSVLLKLNSPSLAGTFFFLLYDESVLFSFTVEAHPLIRTTLRELMSTSTESSIGSSVSSSLSSLSSAATTNSRSTSTSSASSATSVGASGSHSLRRSPPSHTRAQQRASASVAVPLPLGTADGLSLLTPSPAPPEPPLVDQSTSQSAGALSTACASPLYPDIPGLSQLLSTPLAMVPAATATEEALQAELRRALEMSERLAQSLRRAREEAVILRSVSQPPDHSQPQRRHSSAGRPPTPPQPSQPLRPSHTGKPRRQAAPLPARRTACAERERAATVAGGTFLRPTAVSRPVRHPPRGAAPHSEDLQRRSAAALAARTRQKQQQQRARRRRRRREQEELQLPIRWRETAGRRAKSTSSSSSPPPPPDTRPPFRITKYYPLRPTCSRGQAATTGPAVVITLPSDRPGPLHYRCSLEPQSTAAVSAAAAAGAVRAVIAGPRPSCWKGLATGTSAARGGAKLGRASPARPHTHHHHGRHYDPVELELRRRAAAAEVANFHAWRTCHQALNELQQLLLEEEAKERHIAPTVGGGPLTGIRIQYPKLLTYFERERETERDDHLLLLTRCFCYSYPIHRRGGIAPSSEFIPSYPWGPCEGTDDALADLFFFFFCCCLCRHHLVPVFPSPPRLLRLVILLFFTALRNVVESACHPSSHMSPSTGLSQRSGPGPSRETRELVKRRTAELEAATATEEKKFVQGRWATENSVTRNKAVRRRELHSRQLPKRLAKAKLYYQPEDTDTGIELEDREVADRVTQADIVEGVSLQTQRKHFDLHLVPLGPYKIDFSPNGTHLLLGGLRGHLANMQWKQFALQGETQLKDKVNDIHYLVDHSMYAVAQKKYVYMYTKEGSELHILSKMAHMDRLAYLPKHMLLAASSSTYSTMQYTDISTGQEVSLKPPAIMKNPTSCLAVNQANGVVASTDMRGVVKFWAPTVADPLLQLKGHKGAIEDICFHANGRFFLTLGGDHKLKVWDLRTLRTLEEYAITYTFNTMDISSSGLVALGGGTNVQIWKGLFSSQKPSSPFMKFGLGYGNIAERVRFCPFEDVLGVGHSQGFTSMLVPGSGEANPDFYAANPHETERHRKERVVSSLLDKLPPDMISMDIQVPGVNEERLQAYNDQLRANRRARMIREKKLRQTAVSDDSAPTGLANIGDDDELEEEIGFKEKPRTRDIKTKQEKAKERKMKAWDKKDSSDKVRSKQTMRQSRIVQRKRGEIRREERLGRYNKDDLNSDEEAVLAEARQERLERAKRQREDALEEDFRDATPHRGRSAGASREAAAVESNVRTNAAFRRLMR
eukprot:gene9956-6951_t